MATGPSGSRVILSKKSLHLLRITPEKKEREGLANNTKPNCVHKEEHDSVGKDSGK